MDTKKIGIFLVITGVWGAVGVVTAQIILRRRENQKEGPNVDEVLAHMHALKSCLQRAKDGGYGSDQNSEIIQNDFEFNKITYYLKD